MLRGAAYVTAAALMFALAGVAIKFAAVHLPAPLIVWWRNVFSLALLLPLLAWRGPRWVRGGHMMLILMRSLAVLASLYCYYYAVTVIPLADAVLLNFSSPLFIPLFGLALFGFVLDRVAIAALAVGFAGVALVLQPGAGVFQPAALVAVAGGALGGLAIVMLWRMPGGEHPARIAFWLALCGTLVTAPPALWVWAWPAPAAWSALLALGVFSTAAHLLLARGCLIAPVDRVGTLDYTTIVFAAGFGWLLWGERIDAFMLAGAVLIVAAGVMVTRSPAKAGTRHVP